MLDFGPDWRLGRRRGLHPRQLFYAGEQGAAIIPGPSSCFQDSAGTTPVLAAGDPVGLLLDTSQGVSASDSYGPELVTNGGFDTDLTGWTQTGTGFAVSSGQLVFTGTLGVAESLSQVITTTIGATYVITLDVVSAVNLDAGELRIEARDSSSLLEFSDLATSSGALLFTATEASTTIQLRSLTTVDGDEIVTIDNISVREFTRTLDGLGDELVTNGGFDTDTEWAKGTGWSIAAGVASKTTGAQGTLDSAAFAAITGRTYLLTYTVSGRTAGIITPYLAGTALADNTENGETSEVAVFGSGTAYDLRFVANSTFDGSIDNVSVREIPGSHLIQDVNDDYRPTLGRHPDSGLRNLLTYTENFSNAAWSKSAVVTQNAATAPDGTVTAIRLDTSSASDQVYQNLTLKADGTYTQFKFVKAEAGQVGSARFSLYDTGFLVQAFFDYSGGVFVKGISSGSGYVDHGLIDLGDGWYQLWVTATIASNTSITNRFYPDTSGNNSSIFVWHPQLEEGSTATAYQKVTSQYDVTEAGKRDLWYLRPDGVDDYMYVPSLDMSASDKVTVWAGIHKGSDASAAHLIELSASTAANNGSLRIRSPNNPADGDYTFYSKGTSSGIAFGTGFFAPTTNVLTGIGDISGDESTLRVDGTQAATSSLNQGTGNYGTYPLYIGARAGSSLFFNGRIYGLIIRGGASTDAEIAKTERYMARLSGVTL